jgi:hypothetical protein
MTLAAVVLGLFARPVAEQRRRERVLGEAIKLGGIYKAVHPHPVAPSFGQRLLTLFDSSYDDLYLYEVGLAHTAATDADVMRLAELEAIESLDLEGTRVTEKALPALGRLRHLRSLNLNGTRVTDRGLAELEAAKNLFMLRVVGTAVTYDALEQLDKLQPNTNFSEQRALEELHEAGLQVLDEYVNATPPFGVGDSHLRGAAIIGGMNRQITLTNEDVERLNYVESLAELTLHTVTLEAAGLTALKRLPNLKTLEIWTTDVSDADLAAVARQLQLRWLTIYNSRKVTDAGISKLAALGELQYLSVGGCEHVSRESVAAVVADKPACQWRYAKR